MSALFDLPPLPDQPKLSAGQKITLRNRQALANGQHPANGLPMLDDGSTCGDCAHLARMGYRGKTYIKCPHHRFGLSHSEASDMRVSWPACSKFEAKS